MGKSVSPQSSQAQSAVRFGLVLPAERAVRAFHFAGTDPGNALVVEELPGTPRASNLTIRFRSRSASAIPTCHDRSAIDTSPSVVRTMSPSHFHE